jgi:dihydropyrimidinase
MASLLRASRLSLAAVARRPMSIAAAADRDWSKAPPLLLKGGTVVNHDGMMMADVLTEEGKIVHVGPPLPEDQIPAGTRVVDASNRYVIPGGIDTHTHMEMPFMGTVSIDDYHFGTQAAVAGGTTCLIDFVIPGKGQSIVEAHNTWQDRAVRRQR